MSNNLFYSFSFLCIYAVFSLIFGLALPSQAKAEVSLRGEPKLAEKMKEEKAQDLHQVAKENMARVIKLPLEKSFPKWQAVITDARLNSPSKLFEKHINKELKKLNLQDLPHIESEPSNGGPKLPHKLQHKLKHKLQQKLHIAHKVNQYFNNFPYKYDKEIWNITDYWATPREFIKYSGDCEDYAIVKYYALLNLGFKMDKLKIIVLKDNIRQIDHAILQVTIGGKSYILDNIFNQLMKQELLQQYQPYYAVNSKNKWLYF